MLLYITPSKSWWARRELHAQGCLSLSQVDLLFSVNHVPTNGADPETCALFSGYKTAHRYLCLAGRKLAGTAELASARISSVTGRHLDCFGLVPVNGALGRDLTSISDVRSVALCV